LKEHISLLGFLGILIAVFGSYVIHLPSFRFSDLSVPFKALKSKSFLYSMGAGACTVAYSLVNKKNLETVDPLTLLYLIFGFMVLFLFISLAAKNRTSQIKEEAKSNKRNLLLMGILNFVASLLVLYALKISKVSYLGAVRNVSIVFGVLLGSFFLKEGCGKIRLIASLFIFGGIFLCLRHDQPRNNDPSRGRDRYCLKCLHNFLLCLTKFCAKDENDLISG
jgi:drug/metabolite transporter (DMT)-like permease